MSNSDTYFIESSLGMPLLQAVLDHSSACIILAEAPSGKIIYINNAVREFRGKTDVPLTGILLEEYVLSWKDLYPDGTPMKSNEMPLARAIINDEVITNEEIIVELDNGDRKWALATAAPIKDDAGVTVAGIVSWIDITDYKNSQFKLKKEIAERVKAEGRVLHLLKEKELLLKEVHHRIKNNMGTIMSLLNLQSLEMVDEQAVYALQVAENRIRSFSILYEKLFVSDDYRNVHAPAYFENLVSEIISNFPGSDQIKWRTEVDDVSFESDYMFNLGIIINELVTNAMKYAFPDNVSGNITVSLSAMDIKGRGFVVVEDDGAGLPEGFDFSSSKWGFGSQLVKILVEGMNGNIEITNLKGTKISIEFDLEKN